MAEYPELQRVDDPGAGPSVSVRVKPRPVSRVARLTGIGLLAIVLAGAAMVFLVQRTLRSVRPARQAPDTLAAVVPPVADCWERLDLSALPTETVQDLELGRYYYDTRFPGNIALAIGYWRQALEQVSPDSTTQDSAVASVAEPGPALSVLRDLIAAAKKERAEQFSADSEDVFVLLKQGEKDRAIALLERMRADFQEIAAPQYKWASVVLSRQRRKS
jgi:hypothetical protein